MSNNQRRYTENPKNEKQIKVFTIKNFLSIVLCLVLAFTGGILLAVQGTIAGVVYEPEQVQTNPTSTPEETQPENPYTTAQEDANLSLTNGKLIDDPYVLNIMLFGADRKSEYETYGRSDTLILLSIDNRNKEIKITSFLRDLYVDIPGYYSSKINAAYTLGGPSLTIQTVESNFGINIDRYAVVDIDSMEDIIDVLGGIDIELTQEEIDYINWQMSNNVPEERRVVIYDEPGVVHLSGKQAVWYARNRGDEEQGFSGDDFDRTDRQRHLLELIMEDFKDASLTQIVEIVSQIGPMVQTNLKQDEITYLVSNALTYLDYNFIEFRVPTDGVWKYSTTEDKLSIIEITDWEEQRYLLAEFIYEDILVEQNQSYIDHLLNE